MGKIQIGNCEIGNCRPTKIQIDRSELEKTDTFKNVGSFRPCKLANVGAIHSRAYMFHSKSSLLKPF